MIVLLGRDSTVLLLFGSTADQPTRSRCARHSERTPRAIETAGWIDVESGSTSLLAARERDAHEPPRPNSSSRTPAWTALFRRCDLPGVECSRVLTTDHVGAPRSPAPLLHGICTRRASQGVNASSARSCAGAVVLSRAALASFAGLVSQSGNPHDRAPQDIHSGRSRSRTRSEPREIVARAAAASTSAESRSRFAS